MNSNTSTPPADLLAPLLALAAKWRERGEEAFIDDEQVAIEQCADELQSAIDSLSAHSDDGLDFEPDEHHAVADMANVGYSLMQAIARHLPGYVYNDSPAEIVGDLMGDLDDLRKKISDLTGAAHGYKQELESGRAALASHRGEVEPVAWQQRIGNDWPGSPFQWHEITREQYEGRRSNPYFKDYDFRTLYAHPPQAQAQAGAEDGAEMDAFHDGVILALQVLNAGGDTGDAHYVQLVNCCGLDLLVKRAKTEGMMELSGLDVYLRDSRVVADRKRNTP